MRKRREHTTEEILLWIEDHKAGMSGASISKKYDVPKAVVYRNLQPIRNGIVKTGKRYSEIEKQTWLKDFNSGINPHVIAKLYNVDDMTVYRYLQKRGIDTSKHPKASPPVNLTIKVNRNISESEKIEWAKLYNEGKSSLEIGKFFNRDGGTVARHLRLMGVQMKPDGMYRHSKYNEKEQKRNSYMLKAHGLTLDEYRDLLNNQESRCGICKCDLVEGAGAHLDHDHETGKLRSFLCSRCNQGLGLFLDDPEICMLAAEYLNKHKIKKAS